MPMPRNIAAIDLHMSVPTSEHNSEGYARFRPLLRDEESRESFRMPAQYLFKDLPSLGTEKSEFIPRIVAEMDKHGIEWGLISITDRFEHFDMIAERYANRFLFCTPVEPYEGMDEVRRIKRLHKERGLRAVSYFAAGTFPQIAINAPEMYPIYATCCELGIPIFVNVGVPGPRIPLTTQRVELVDEVCWFFPELVMIMRHGGEPWVDLAVKLLLKYPNLYYSTSAFAPKHYPREIIDYANKRGADKIMYAGYFPSGLSLDRIFTELENVPFTDAVWPKFLRENAARVFGL